MAIQLKPAFVNDTWRFALNSSSKTYKVSQEVPNTISCRFALNAMHVGIPSILVWHTQVSSSQMHTYPLSYAATRRFTANLTAIIEPSSVTGFKIFFWPPEKTWCMSNEYSSFLPEGMQSKSLPTSHLQKPSWSMGISKSRSPSLLHTLTASVRPCEISWHLLLMLLSHTICPGWAFHDLIGLKVWNLWNPKSLQVFQVVKYRLHYLKIPDGYVSICRSTDELLMIIFSWSIWH